MNYARAFDISYPKAQTRTSWMGRTSITVIALLLALAVEEALVIHLLSSTVDPVTVSTTL